MAEIQHNARTDVLLRRLIRRDAEVAVQKLLEKSRVEDIADAMERLTWAEQRRLFGLIQDKDYAAELLSYLSEVSSREVSRDLDHELLMELLDRMQPDDATDVVELLTEERREQVIADFEDDETGEVVKDLLAYDSESAGGIMSPSVFKVRNEATCGEAIAQLQQQNDELESVYYAYVVDHVGRLVGVSSLRRLVTSAPMTPIEQVMSQQVIKVAPEQDQEEVAQFVARYDLLSVPVCDEDGILLGIVTVDDVVDVIREEAAEDMLRMAGVVDDEAGEGILRQTSVRAGWLVATLLGGIFAAEIIAGYEDTMAKVAVLAGFIPVIMGMGGNVGIQSATVTVRGIATGRVQPESAMGFLAKEAQVGLLLGIVYALALGGYGLVRFNSVNPMIGVSLGVSILLAMGLASVLGSGIPVVLDRFRIDPAVATGPFVTTIVDVVAIVVYFNVARLLLGL